MSLCLFIGLSPLCLILCCLCVCILCVSLVCKQSVMCSCMGCSKDVHCIGSMQVLQYYALCDVCHAITDTCCIPLARFTTTGHRQRWRMCAGITSGNAGPVAVHWNAPNGTWMKTTPSFPASPGTPTRQPSSGSASAEASANSGHTPATICMQSHCLSGPVLVACCVIVGMYKSAIDVFMPHNAPSQGLYRLTEAQFRT